MKVSLSWSSLIIGILLGFGTGYVAFNEKRRIAELEETAIMQTETAHDVMENCSVYDKDTSR